MYSSASSSAPPPRQLPPLQQQTPPPNKGHVKKNPPSAASSSSMAALPQHVQQLAKLARDYHTQLRDVISEEIVAKLDSFYLGQVEHDIFAQYAAGCISSLLQALMQVMVNLDAIRADGPRHAFVQSVAVLGHDAMMTTLQHAEQDSRIKALVVLLYLDVVSAACVEYTDSAEANFYYKATLECLQLITKHSALFSRDESEEVRDAEVRHLHDAVFNLSSGLLDNSFFSMCDFLDWNVPVSSDVVNDELLLAVDAEYGNAEHGAVPPPGEMTWSSMKKAQPALHQLCLELRRSCTFAALGLEADATFRQCLEALKIVRAIRRDIQQVMEIWVGVCIHATSAAEQESSSAPSNEAASSDDVQVWHDRLGILFGVFYSLLSFERTRYTPDEDNELNMIMMIYIKLALFLMTPDEAAAHIVPNSNTGSVGDAADVVAQMNGNGFQNLQDMDMTDIVRVMVMAGKEFDDKQQFYQAKFVDDTVALLTALSFAANPTVECGHCSVLASSLAPQKHIISSSLVTDVTATWVLSFGGMMEELLSMQLAYADVQYALGVLVETEKALAGAQSAVTTAHTTPEQLEAWNILVFNRSYFNVEPDLNDIFATLRLPQQLASLKLAEKVESITRRARTDACGVPCLYAMIPHAASTLGDADLLAVIGRICAAIKKSNGQFNKLCDLLTLLSNATISAIKHQRFVCCSSMRRQISNLAEAKDDKATGGGAGALGMLSALKSMFENPVLGSTQGWIVNETLFSASTASALFGAGNEEDEDARDGLSKMHDAGANLASVLSKTAASMQDSMFVGELIAHISQMRADRDGNASSSVAERELADIIL